MFDRYSQKSKRYHFLQAIFVYGKAKKLQDRFPVERIVSFILFHY